MGKKFTPLSDSEWVVKAASKDKARPVLTHVNVDPFALAATDGHRLHIASYMGDGAMQLGSWDPKQPGRLMADKYPDFWKVVGEVKVDGTYNTLDASQAIPVLKGAVAYGKEKNANHQAFVTLPATTSAVDGHGKPIPAYVRIAASYLLDVVVGRRGAKWDILYVAPGPMSPVMFVIADLLRIALVMPIRSGEPDKPEVHFDLTPYTSRWEFSKGVPEPFLPVAEKATPGGSSGKRNREKKSNG